MRAIQSPHCSLSPSLPFLSGTKTNPNILIIIKRIRKACLLDLGSCCLGLLINNYKSPQKFKTPSQHQPWKRNLSLGILLGALQLLLVTAQPPHHLLFPRYPVAQMELTEETSVKSPFRSSLAPKYPAIICTFLQKVLSVPHQQSSLNANKNQYFRFYRKVLELLALL